MATVSVPFAPLVLKPERYLSYATDSFASVLPQAHSPKSITSASSMHKYFETFFILFTLTFVRYHKFCS